VSSDLRVLAVDDERPALDDLAQLLCDHPDVSAVSTADSGVAALQALTRSHVDAVFLDVRMPDFDGIELGRVLKLFDAPPAIVFVTAYQSAAVAAFELGAADYLMKPVTRERLSEALDRVTHDTSVQSPVDDGMHDQAEIDSHSEVLAVYTPRGSGVRLLPRSSILYLEAFGDYQRVFSTDGRFLLHGSLLDLERKWAPYGFVRVHRKFIVNLRHATAARQHSTGAWMLTFSDGSDVPIARRHLTDLRRHLEP
jgi:two-component system, LytTR family, response regulator